MAFELTSRVFTDGGWIPPDYTCDGKNISPPLAWSNAPAETNNFVLIMDDPDAPAGTWDHWLLYGISNSTTGFEEDFRESNSLVETGRNSWGNLRYQGPCPPSGAHHYIFTLYAVDEIALAPSLTKAQILSQINGHILAKAILTGKYQRQ